MAEQVPTTFFSYSRQDSDFVLRLVKDLRAAGANVWLDQIDIPAGQHWDRAVESALHECRRQVVVLSPASVNSENVMDEVSYALEGGKQVIPVLYRECEVPFRLRRLEYIDFRSDYDAGLRTLLKSLSTTGPVPAVPSQPSADVPGAARPQTGPPKRSLLKNPWMIAGIVCALAVVVALGAWRMLARPGPIVVSASADQTLKVWDLESGRQLQTLQGHSGKVWGVAVNADGQRAISASEDKTLKVWDLQTGKEIYTLSGHTGAVYGVAMSRDGRRALSVSIGAAAVALSADGGRAVCAYTDNTLGVWDPESGRELRLLEGHKGLVLAIALTPDGKRAVSASVDKTLKVWDVQSGRELRTLEGHSERVHGVAVSADGRIAISAARDNTLKVWDLENGKELRTLRGHSDNVDAVALSADGHTAVSASWDNTLKVWDVQSGRELRTLRGHSAFVTAVALAENGK